MSKLDATHILDIIAGGSPSDISGLKDRSTNRSMGSQWKGKRSQALEDYARDKAVKGEQQLDVALVEC